MLAALLVLAFALQFGSHYLPWARLIGASQLPRPVAYIIGVIGILIPVAAWLVILNQVFILLIIVAFCACAGAGVIAGYTLDKILDWRDQAHEARQREEMLQDQRQGAGDDKDD